MKEIDDTIMDWLHDAHAMEQQAESMLSIFSERLENYPELRDRVEKNRRTAQSRQRLLKDCIESAGGSTSLIKDMGAKFIGFSQAVSGIFVSDEVAKGILGMYVYQQMAVASYTMLRSAIKHLGDTRTLQICEQLLSDANTMVEELKSYLPVVTEQYLTRKSVSPDTAKR